MEPQIFLIAYRYPMCQLSFWLRLYQKPFSSMRKLFTTQDSHYSSASNVCYHVHGMYKESDDSTPPVSNTIVDVVVGNANTTLLELLLSAPVLPKHWQTTQTSQYLLQIDDAFRMLDIDGDGTPDLDTKRKINALDPALLVEVLSFHVIAAKVPAADVSAGPNALLCH
jgi:hypothetical protein